MTSIVTNEYQRASIIEAVDTRTVFSKKSASILIKCEYMAVNQIKIFGLNIAIKKP